PTLFAWWLLEGLARLQQDDAPPRHLTIAGWLVAAPIVAVSNELAAPVTLLILLAIGFALLKRRHKLSCVLLAGAVGLAALAGFGLLLSSPGNALRLADYPDSGGALGAPFRAVGAVTIFIALRLFGTPALLGWLGLATIISALDTRSRPGAPRA